jgi:uncharacterized protein (DUF58 family)
MPVIFDEAFLRKLEALRFAVRRAVSGRREGDRLTRKRGGSAEFTSHRSYAQGDDIRSIDWNLYGRLGLLYVKEFSREEALEVRLAVDTTPSMAPKFDFARRLGAALALVANQEASNVPLAEIEALRVGAPFVVPPAPRGLLILVSDLWDEDLRDRLMAVRAERAVIHVLSPEEAVPPFSGKVKFVDAETGEGCVRFVGDEERAEYRRLLAVHCAAWKRWCFDHEINYLRVVSDQPLEEIVQVYLREAGVLE